MKLVFDIDGTITDYNKFIETVAIPYFSKTFGMQIANPNELELVDIFDMKSFFSEINSNDEEINRLINEALDRFWIGPQFIKYSILYRFRPGFKEFATKHLKDGHIIEIHSSRDKTCAKGLIGYLTRGCTYLQFLVNGIPIHHNKFFFYNNDSEKVAGIQKSNPDIVFDDKPQIIRQLNDKKIKTICVKGKHNLDISPKENIEVIQGFDTEIIINKMSNLLGRENLTLNKRIMLSERFTNKCKILIPIIKWYFKPIILHKENVDFIQLTKEAVICTSNHRSTLDPIVMTSIITKNIYWTALKRFFDGADSIFLNSKNPILCNLTSYLFKKLGYFPIERKCDNPNANNYSSIKEMNAFLKAKQCLGIFPEGTTKRQEGFDFGTFDPFFLRMAQRNNAFVCPITVLWINENNIKNKIIVNFGEPFFVEKEISIDEALNNFINIQHNLLQENRSYVNKLGGG